jgi:hypothetical protein
LKLPANALKVTKGIDRTFNFLLDPGNFSGLIKDEFHGKVIYDKKAPMEKGKTTGALIPANKGQPAIDTELEECASPPAQIQDSFSHEKEEKRRGYSVVIAR